MRVGDHLGCFDCFDQSRKEDWVLISGVNARVFFASVLLFSSKAAAGFFKEDGTKKTISFRMKFSCVGSTYYGCGGAMANVLYSNKTVCVQFCFFNEGARL